MNSYALKEEEKKLDSYLNQYGISIKEKKALQYRRQEIKNEFEKPLRSTEFGKGKSSQADNSECASLAIRLYEIEKKIIRQTSEAEKTLFRIMDIIDFLPEHSLERLIVEHKYIDQFGWTKISMTCGVSKRTAMRRCKKALNILLGFERVRELCLCGRPQD